MKIKKIIDLTHVLDEHNPTWEGGCGFEASVTCDYNQSAGETRFRVHSLSLKNAGTGTHIDAPLHCFPSQSSVADLSLENLIAPVIVIDVSARAHAHYLISLDDIYSFESLYGAIAAENWVVFYTGWGAYWHDTKHYRNEDAHGGMNFPAVAAEVALLLVARGVVGIAIDTLSPDRSDSGYPVHRILLEHNIPIIENLAAADQLPAHGAYLVALPLKTKTTEAPVRVIALIV